MALQGHRWQFFRAGAVDQVSLRDGFDLLALPDLDQKLWVALAMPTHDVDVDAKTLELLDVNKDGRIRVQDILDAVAEIKRCFKNPSEVLRSADAVALDQIADAKVLAAIKRMLADLGKKTETQISIADTDAVTKAFETTVLNGDAIIIPASADEGPVREAIEAAIASVGSVTDRSGKPGIDKALCDAFFDQVEQHNAWFASGKDLVANEAAADAYLAIKDKLEDYFTRCRLAAYDNRAQTALAAADAELAALTTKQLTHGDAAIEALPLAKVDAAARLPLRSAVNPAWADRLAAFTDKTVVPLLGARELLTPADLAQIADKLAALLAWRAAKPVTKVAGLAKLPDASLRSKVHDLIAADAALADEYAQLTTVQRVVHYQRDFGRILRNFVNFSDFYSKKDGVFQAGTLYIDGRALHLCIPVSDAGKHGALAGSSAACLIYCDIKRDGVMKQIAAALTNGDDDNIFVGRNGIFYDRDGKDWDATVAKIVTNPISVRQAFWSPYKRLVKAIEDNFTKRAQAAETASNAKLDAAAASVDTAADVGKQTAANGGTPPEPVAKKIDLGTIAAIGVAIGGIGTLFGALLSTMFGLGAWLPLGLIALMLLISGPAMLLAWLKLRRRNLGPILDANGWAINGRARINVSFGAAMTELAKIPQGSQRVLSDPFADKHPPWKLYLTGVTLVVLAGTWYVGRLDKYLPESIRSVSVLGTSAPAYKAPTPAPAAATSAPTVPAPAPTPAK
ncbi:MAG: hypothetical protein JO257_27130 [Deltaproteobacteria bacterium]|nr:hypothetical protein [Deltaproteobacteria bacterium]